MWGQQNPPAPGFDSVQGREHPWFVILDRAVAFFVVLALSAASPAICRGWVPTPEARMACCQDEATCPMHAKDPDRTDSRRVVTQRDADRCCAASEKDDSGSSGSAPLVAFSLEVATSPVPLVVPAPAIHPGVFALSAGASPERVPRHLQLSVLLV